MPAMRILIIEDDRQAASYLVKVFREAGHVADDAADPDRDDQSQPACYCRLGFSQARRETNGFPPKLVTEMASVGQFAHDFDQV